MQRQTMNPFPDTKLIMEALNRPRGSTLYHGDYEVASLLLDTKGEETMWDYFNQRVGDILDTENYRLNKKLEKNMEQSNSLRESSTQEDQIDELRFKIDTLIDENNRLLTENMMLKSTIQRKK